MTFLSNGYYRIYVRVRRSIVFVPSIIGTSFFIFALIINTIERSQYAILVREWVSFALVTDVETARVVLSILIGGIISLTVFSFSMVMLSINQATANLSPAVVPALLADPLRQKILGFYLGTITFYLILTININAPESEYTVPALGILISYLLAIICLTLFVYFISSISRSLQIDTILQDLYDNTLRQIKTRINRWNERLADSEQKPVWPSDDNWHLIRTINAGYFKSVNEEHLKSLMSEFDFSGSVQLYRGQFAVIGQPLIKVSKPLDSETQTEVAECFVFYIEEFVQDHYSFGIKQISQIGIKALSPGINDPVSAIKCIQMLSLIFIEMLRLGEFERIATKDDHNACYLREYYLKDLIFIALAPLCKYAEADTQTLIAIIISLRDVIVSSECDDTKALLFKFTDCLTKDIDNNISNGIERERINQHLQAINQLSEGQHPQIALLADYQQSAEAHSETAAGKG